MTVQAMQRAYFCRFMGERYEIMAPNTIPHLRWCEMDICGVRKSGFVDEIEIKCSRADYAADFKKTIGFGALAKNKHELLQSGTGVPNYFSFLVPADLIQLEDIPQQYGVYYFSYFLDRPRINQARKPMRLHGRKCDDAFRQKVLMSTMWRYWRMLGKQSNA